MRVLPALSLLPLVGCVSPEVGSDTDGILDEPPIEDDRPVVPEGAVPCGAGWCFAVDAPVDPRDPDGATVRIEAMMIPASSEEPLGTLLVNYGGFGAPGLPMLAGWAQGVPALREHFNLVSWDPRGSGSSEPFNCLQGFDRVLQTSGPVDDEGAREAIAVRTALLDDCRAEHGSMVDHMGYRAHASDMEAVRQALDVERIDYLGYSAGTALGQAYAELYPQHVAGMVLDSAVPAHGGARTLMSFQAPEGARALQDFADWCTSDPSCGWDEPVARIEEVLAMTERGAVRLGPLEALTWAEAAYGIILTLYTPNGYPAMVPAIESALLGDGAQLDMLGAAYLGRSGSQPVASWHLIYYLTNCSEEVDPTTAEDFLDALAAYTDHSALGPIYATDHAWCAAYGPGADPLGGPVTAPDVEQTILVLQSDLDLATPLVAGQEVADTLEDARLVVYEGAGHTPSAFDPCMAGIVADYFVDDVIPPEGTTCAPSR